jgi:hypothetical protein
MEGSRSQVRLCPRSGASRYCKGPTDRGNATGVDEFADVIWGSTLWYVQRGICRYLPSRLHAHCALFFLLFVTLAAVQQVLPKNSFGALTVLHLPNKNYRRVGKYRKRQFGDGTEVFEEPHGSLLTAMELHLSVRKMWPSKPQVPYRGTRMIDEVNLARDRSPLLERRMREYEEYEKRGGVLSEGDMVNIDLVEAE